jgi:hypothetical protein
MFDARVLQRALEDWDVAKVIEMAGRGTDCGDVIANELRNNMDRMQVMCVTCDV